MDSDFYAATIRLDFHEHSRYIHDPLMTEWHDNPVDLNAETMLKEDSFGITPLHYAFISPKAPLPTELLSSDILTKKLSSGLTLLHIAAATGKLNFLPDEFLTPENLSVQDDNGRTPIHIAVELAFLPKCGLTVKSLSVPDTDGNTPMHLCCYPEWIDKPLFPMVPASLITPETMLTRNKQGETPLHLLAHAEAFQYLPKGFLSPEMLLISDNNGYTVCHHALGASDFHFGLCGLERFPKECLTAEVLLKKDNAGFPVLYYAAKIDLKYIPEEFKTEKFFLSDKYDGDTLFHIASIYVTVFDLPALLTVENLLIKGREGKTPVEHIAQYVIRGQPQLFDKCLGLDFPESAKDHICSLPTGEEWWARNKEYIRSKNSLRVEGIQYERGEMF